MKQKRPIRGKHNVYFWADGIYFNVRLEEGLSCLLVIVVALSYGYKEAASIYDGHRESKPSWSEELNDLKRRG